MDGHAPDRERECVTCDGLREGGLGCKREASLTVPRFEGDSSFRVEVLRRGRLVEVVGVVLLSTGCGCGGGVGADVLIVVPLWEPPTTLA